MVIRYWQGSALISLDDIAEMLAGHDRAGAATWRELVGSQIGCLRERIARMEAARALLEQVASHHDTAPDGCPPLRGAHLG